MSLAERQVPGGCPASAGSRRFRGHLRRLEPVFQALRASGRTDRLVLGILAVEGFLRPAPQRAGEYLLWIACSVRPAPRCDLLSVGLSQVQLRHWAALGALPGTSYSRSSLAIVMSASANYDVCRDYLALHADNTATAPLADLVKHYTGGRSRRYLRLLVTALSAIDAEADRERSAAVPKRRRSQRPHR